MTIYNDISQLESVGQLHANSLVNADCLEAMKFIPDKSIDMILCDLPYGTTACKWDVIIPFAELWKQYERIIKDNGAIVLTASQPFTSALVMSNVKMFKYEWIWKKNRGSGHLNAKIMPMKYHENVLVFGKARTTFNPINENYSKTTTDRFKKGDIYKSKLKIYKKDSVYGEFKSQDRIYIREEGKSPSSIQEIKTVNIQNGERIHPTQKPVALMEYLIKTYTNEGETVLDNCMGSASTIIACKNLNRNFIGIEKDEKYFEIAVNRILN